MNIADKLIRHLNFRKTGEVLDGRPVYKRENALLVFPAVENIHANDLDKRFDVDEVIFASRHASKIGKLVFCVHAPGNFDKALFGGRDKELARANPLRMRSLLLSLFKAQADLPSYSVTLEATHHGPTEMNVPVSFVEIGSSEDQWKDAEAGFLVAKAIWEAISKPLSGLPAVGFGGKHYSATFTKAVLERGVAMGHIVPKYAVEGVNEEIVRQAVRKTEGCRCAVLDWDGLRGEQRRKLTTLLKREGLDVIKV